MSYTITISPQCTGSPETCSCADCTKLSAFTTSSWYTFLYESEHIKPYFSDMEAPMRIHADALRIHRRGVTQELGNLDEEILAVETYLSKLKRHRMRVLEVDNCYDSILSPIRRLPFEIVRSILLLVDVEDFDVIKKSEDGRETTLSNGPWDLTKVCSQWRAVALQTPVLWSAITLSFVSGTDDSDPSSVLLLCILEEGLRRSKSKNLSVTLHNHGDFCDYDHESHPVPMLVNRLMSYSGRFAQLSFDFATEHNVRHILDIFSVPFKSLKYVDIRIRTGYRSDYFKLLRRLATASSLMEVTLHGDTVLQERISQSRLEDLGLCWKELKVFSAREYALSAECTLALLRLCPQLTVFEHIISTTNDLESTSTIASITECRLVPAFLVELYINLVHFLEHVDIPALQYLTITGEVKREGVACLNRFITRSQCSIKTISFLHLASPPPVSLFQSLSKVESFRVFGQSRHIIREIISHLTTTEEDHDLKIHLPCLRELELDSIDDYQSSEIITKEQLDQLMHMLRSRSAFGPHEGFHQSPISFLYNQHLTLNKKKRAKMDALLKPFEADLTDWECGYGMEIIFYRNYTYLFDDKPQNSLISIST